MLTVRASEREGRGREGGSRVGDGRAGGNLCLRLSTHPHTPSNCPPSSHLPVSTPPPPPLPLLPVQQLSVMRPAALRDTKSEIESGGRNRNLTGQSVELHQEVSQAPPPSPYGKKKNQYPQRTSALSTRDCWLFTRKKKICKQIPKKFLRCFIK